MAIWDIFTRNKTSRYAIVDVEVGLKDHKIHDIGVLRQDGVTFHKASKEELLEFLHDTDYLCGHNIIHHDAKYLFPDKDCRWTLGRAICYWMRLPGGIHCQMSNKRCLLRC